MKNAVKTISLLLAAACFMLAVTGFYGIYKANKNYDRDCGYLESMAAKTDRFRDIKTEVDDHSAEYRAANLGLEEKIAEYEEAASEHREELAIYTATRSGVKTGEEMLNKAWGPLSQGKAKIAQYDEQFQEMYQKFQESKAALEQGWQLYYAAVAQLQLQKEQLAAGKELLNGKLAELEATLQAIPELSEEELAQISLALTAVSGYETKISEAETEEDKAAAEAEAEGFAQLSGYESLEDMKTKLLAAASSVQLRAQLLAGKQELEARLQEAEAGEQQIATGEAVLEGKKAELDTAQAMIDAGEPGLIEGKEQLEAAKKAMASAAAKVYSAKKKLDDTKAELKETGVELSDEVMQLIEDKEDIDRRQAIVDGYELLQDELEASERSLKSIDEIKELSGDNKDVLELAESVYREYSENSEHLRLNGILSGAVAIFTLVIAAIAIMSAFGFLKLKFFSFLPAFDCLLLALCAQKLRYVCNTAIMWSALITAVFALTLFVLNISSAEARTE